MTSTKKRIKALNLLRDLAGESSATYDAVTTLQEALCDAAQLDGMREAERLRGRAALEAWSGSLSGLDEAERLSAKAEALAALSIAAPTAEEQRDAAFAKIASLIAERNQLRRIVDTISRLALDASTPRAQLDCVIVDLREQAGLPRSV